MSRVLVNVQTYADFDVPGTHVIMEAPDFVEADAIRGIIKTIENENLKNDDVDDVVKQLKSLGFSVCKTIDLDVGGGL